MAFLFPVHSEPYLIYIVPRLFALKSFIEQIKLENGIEPFLFGSDTTIDYFSSPLWLKFDQKFHQRSARVMIS